MTGYVRRAEGTAGHEQFALGLLLATEMGITLADFIVEDQVRKPHGGLLPGERATRTIMAIIRDTYAVAGFPRGTARWPWPKPSSPQPSSPVGGAR